MAKDTKSLTKYKSAVTIVTADVANSWFGGLYGSPESQNLPSDDPLVAGHIHDGKHLDGHAQKINLVHHVTGQLRNVNIANDAIDKRTVNKFINQADAIPEFEIINSEPHYYLDLSDIRSEIQNISSSGVFKYDENADLISYNTSMGPDNGTTSFVAGSASLDYQIGDVTKFFFDKSTGSLRLGSISTDAWDAPKRGSNSLAWGSDTTAAGDFSFSGGMNNLIDSDSNYSSIVNGSDNTIEGADYSQIRNGFKNDVVSSGEYSNIGGIAGRGYLYNQFALSGGYFDTDGSNNPTPKGQIQTSVLVASGTLTQDDAATELFLDQPLNTKKLYIPEKTSAVAKITWVARSSDAPNSKTSGGHCYVLISRETGAAVEVQRSAFEFLSSEFMSGVYLVPEGLTGDLKIEAITSGLPTHPTRISVKIEWTEIYLDNSPL